MELAISRLLGLRKTSRESSWDYWIQRSRKGLPKSSLVHFTKTLHLNFSELANLLPVSERTLQRYPEDKILNRDLSGHLVALAKVYARAAEVFEDEEKARRWLLKPCRALGGEIPFSLLDSPLGIQAVEDELVRIEYGVYY